MAPCVSAASETGRIMNVIKHIILSILTGSVWLLPAGLYGQSDGDECRGHLAEALALRNQPPDEGFALYRKMTVTTVRRSENGIDMDTLTMKSETIEAGSVYVIRSDSGELRQDSTTLVVVDSRRKTVRVVGLGDRRDVLAARRHMQEMFSDSLPVHARSVECRREGANRSISFAILPERQRLYNAHRITLDVRPDGEIVRFALEHPPGGLAVSTEYVVEEINRRYDGIDLTRPVREQVLDDAGRLRPEYNGYRLQGRVGE